MHYRAYGAPQKDAQGIVRNAVLVMHGTGGTGAQFVSASFAGELFGPGQLLDATKYFIVLPDDVGHGKSSIPLGDKTAGHGTHTLAAVWKSYLEELLRLSAR